MVRHSTRRGSRGKPAPKPKKPSKDFPLGIHKGTGYWRKKVRGRVYYFGKVADDPHGEEALKLWLEQKDDLLAGREPREASAGTTIKKLCDEFMNHAESKKDNKEISPRTFQTYYATCAAMVKAFGRGRVVVDLVPNDFRLLREKLAKKRKAAVSLRNEITRVRSVFNYGVKEQLIANVPPYGASFELPSQDVIRRARTSHQVKHGLRMFEAAELRTILSKSEPQMRAIVLLGINAGFGQTDISSLPKRAVNLDAGWVDYPRPKTSVGRRVPLWPETVDAIRAWLNIRPKAKHKADEGLLFLTRFGQRWVKLNANGSPADALGQEFSKILKSIDEERKKDAEEAGIDPDSLDKFKRPGVSFYALRHGFETQAGESTDQVAVDHIMGHLPRGMSAIYREKPPSDVRLKAVANIVREWLFPPQEPTGDGAKEEPASKAKPKKAARSKPVDADESPTRLRLFAG